MAKIVNSGNAGDISGKSGKIVYGHNAHGFYQYEYVKSKKPLTEAQKSKNKFYSVIALEWRSLSEETRGTNGIYGGMTELK